MWHYGWYNAVFMAVFILAGAYGLTLAIATACIILHVCPAIAGQWLQWFIALLNWL